MSETLPVLTRVRTATAVLLTAALALAGAVIGMTPANAAGPAATASALDWGFKASWAGYIGDAGGTITPSGGAAVADGHTTWAASAAAYDPATKAGSASFAGSIRYVAYGGVLDITLSDPELDFAADGSAELSWSVNGGAPIVGATGAAGAVTVGAPTTDGGTATVSVASAGLTITADGAAVFGRYAGEATDALAFTISYAVAAPGPVATATTIAVSPASPVTVGTSITVTPTVTPTAAGTVELFDGTTSLGSKAAGESFTLTSLGIGSHSLTATFTPTDTAAFQSSTSDATVVEVGAAPSNAVTIDALTVTPSAPVVKGTSVTLTATLSDAADQAVTAGTVQFSAIPASGAAAVAIGAPVAVVGGVATITTTELKAGGQTFKAAYLPAGSYLGTETTTTANYGIVDTAISAPCLPAAGALTSTGASASWNWSVYAADWTKNASGDITLDGQTFQLADGAVTADADCAVIEFSGSMRTTAYGAYWVELVDPTLTVKRDGTGSWTADVRSGSTAYTGSEPTTRVTVAKVSSATGLPAAGSTGDATIGFAYAKTTAAGTWSVAGGIARTDAWTNEFILEVPSLIRSFYYSSGLTRDPDKPAAPLTLSVDWPAVSKVAVAASPASPVLGSPVTVTATVTPAAATGTVELFAKPASGSEYSLGTATVSAGTAAVTTSTLPAGGTTFRAEYVSDNGFTDSVGTSTSFGVVDTSVPAVCEPGPDASTVYAVTGSWDWSTYSAEWAKVASGSISVDGQTFRLADGIASVGDDCTVIRFSGTMRTSAYASFFPPDGQWIELVDPVLTIDAHGDGSWSAGVRSGAGAYSATPTVERTIATISGADLPDLSTVGSSTTVTPDYTATTASGTWSAGRVDAWANGFVLAVPSSIRSFYYASGANGDVKKAPSPITVTKAAPLATTTTLATSASTLAEGTGLTLTATVAPGASGTVTFTDGDTVIGTRAVAGAPATLGVTPGAGAHTYQAAFAPTNALRHAASASAVATVTVEAPAAPAALTSGVLRWGVRDSFVSYITGPIAKGSISVSGGAGYGGGVYLFPQSGGDFDRAAGTGTAAYRGTVSFSGHHGELALSITDPIITVGSNGTGLLSVVSGGSRVEFATLAVSGAAKQTDASGAVTYTSVPATLTAAGSALFRSGSTTFYPAGTALSPLTFTIGAPSAAALGGGIVATAATATSRTPAPTPPATTGITVTGEAVAGRPITIEAPGFQPNEQDILVVVYSEPLVLGTANADAQGIARWTGVLPAGLTGTHTLTMQGSIDVGVVIQLAPAVTIEGCTVEDATLTWGFKESFRSYLTSTIANGEWTVADGASYETPSFGWEGEGVVDPETQQADLQFAGSVRFTGHEGALDTTIANPRILVTDDVAVLLLDVTGETRDGEQTSVEGVEFAKLDLSGVTPEIEDGVVTWTDIPATLAAGGASAFGTYEEGEALDPVTVAVELPADCGATTTVEPVGTPEETAIDEPAAPDLAWIWWLVAALVLVAAVVTVSIVLARRRA